MAKFGSDQLKCSLVQNLKDKSINYVLSTLDGSPVEEIDIGQDDWPYHWPKDKQQFFWKFIDHTPDMRADVQRVAFQEAFNSIQKLTKLAIDYEKDSTKNTDITVEWKEDIDTFDGQFGVLAHAYLYYPGSDYNGVMEFNDSIESNWHFTPLGEFVEAYHVDPANYLPGSENNDGGPAMLESQPVISIAMHELGHILFGHHDLINENSLMYPYAQPGYIDGVINRTAFCWDDITSIPRMRALFGTSGISDSHLERWRKRRMNESTYRRYQ